jgi:3-phenylpropionate/trans-cinnamate dioxygenase ferredoxin reductase component
MSSLDHVVVVGASAAGLSAVETLRMEGYSGLVTLIGDEEELPYDRPPLSKQVLAGAWGPTRTRLRGHERYRELQVRLRLGEKATGLDVESRQLSLADGSHIAFDAAIIATGAQARSLPFGHDIVGVSVLRTMADALRLRAQLAVAERVVISGAGFLGLEIASVARQMGKDVTVVHPRGLPMMRPFGAPVAAFIRDLHIRNGVRFRPNTTIVDVVGTKIGRVKAVRLSDGLTYQADLVVVAIGADPCTDWLAGCGLSTANGVDCDDRCAAAPGIYAAGDVASWINPLFGSRMRTENRMNATEQGRCAAQNLLGRGKAYAPVPYYWTDQYEIKLQAYGVFPLSAKFEVVAGDLVNGRFLAYYVDGNRVVGAVGNGLPAHVRKSRSAIEQGTGLDQALALIAS